MRYGHERSGVKTTKIISSEISYRENLFPQEFKILLLSFATLFLSIRKRVLRTIPLVNLEHGGQAPLFRPLADSFAP